MAFGRTIVARRLPKVASSVRVPQLGGITGAAATPELSQLAHAFVPRHFTPRVSSQLFKARIGNVGGSGFHSFTGKY